MATLKQKESFVKYILETQKFRDVASREFLEFIENDFSLAYIKFVTPLFYYEEIYGKKGVKGVLIHATTSSVVGVKTHHTLDGKTDINRMHEFNDDIINHPFDVHYVAIDYKGFSTDYQYTLVLDEKLPYNLEKAQKNNDIFFVDDYWAKNDDEIMNAYEEKDLLTTNDIGDTFMSLFTTLFKELNDARNNIIFIDECWTKGDKGNNKTIESFMEYSLYLGKKRNLERLIDESLVNGNKADFNRYTSELNELEEPKKLFEII